MQVKILSKAQIIDLENQIISVNNLTSLDLISAAAESFVLQFIKYNFNTNHRILIYCGNGKNGADGIEIAKRLIIKGFDIEIFFLTISPTTSPEFLESTKQFPASIPNSTISLDQLKDHIVPDHDILIDGILGIGLSRSISGELLSFIHRLNKIKSYKIAIDIPTGVHTDEGSKFEALECDETIALGVMKKGYFLDEHIDNIGTLRFAPISYFEEFMKFVVTELYYIDSTTIKQLLNPYERIIHKYNVGSCVLVGGRVGMSGCMLLSSRAALKSGCGLIKVHVPASSSGFIQGEFPEAIVLPDISIYEVTNFEIPDKTSAIGIGPGMGYGDLQINLLEKLMKEAHSIPLLLDADALRTLSQIDDWRTLIPKDTILTPHLGEFDRLFGSFVNQSERIDFMQKISKELKITILLKGADTVISTPSGDIYFNNTSNAGMATGGSGDVLTGIITSLLAQGYKGVEAALIGVFLHGTAGNIAREQMGFRSLIASDIVDNIGNAYISIEEHF